MAPLRSLHNLQADFPPRSQAPQPGAKGPTIRLIGPDEAHACILMSQEGEE